MHAPVPTEEDELLEDEKDELLLPDEELEEEELLLALDELLVELAAPTLVLVVEVELDAPPALEEDENKVPEEELLIPDEELEVAPFEEAEDPPPPSPPVEPDEQANRRAATETRPRCRRTIEDSQAPEVGALRSCLPGLRQVSFFSEPRSKVIRTYAASTGSVIVKVLPSPRLLSTRISPPC